MLRNKRGMELVQVAILIALAVALGLIFKSEITEFVNNTFEGLNG
ncbi:MAG: Flp1 family type IVb pilin [Emergencia sp.]|nr:Flp1 family type IVb pilin [Emergencia sp.]